MSTPTDDGSTTEDEEEPSGPGEVQLMEVDNVFEGHVSGDGEASGLSQDDHSVLEAEHHSTTVVIEDDLERGEVNFMEEQHETGYEEAQFLDENQVLVLEGEDTLESDYIVTEDAIVIGGEEDVVVGMDGDVEDVTVYEETEGEYSNAYAPELLAETEDESGSMIVEDSVEVIEADTEVVETVIDSSVMDDDKENGESILPEYPDEAEIEPVLEIARRRLSHEGNCYCGKDRNLNIVELLCASCHRWYHESCIGYQLGKLVPFMMNYIFICKNCSPTGLETFKRNQAPFTQMCVTAIANLTQASVKDGTNRQLFSKDKDVIPFFEMHWEGMTTLTRRVTQSWRSTVTRTLQKEVGLLFTVEDVPEDSDSPYFGLLALDLTQIRPNYEAMIRAGHLKLSELLQSSGQSIRRGSAKRRTVGGEMLGPSSQASIAKKSRGDNFLAKSVLGHGYPSEHPFNKDGYRYVLAEPDSNAPFRQEFDESSDWAGKPIPGWLYRVLNPSIVLLALHDRAPQLKVSEDRFSVTGDKGYCMIRSTHGVSKGCWYWEAKITELPDGSATRIGWSQIHANLQAPLGFDKFSYSWRSRYGTKFHQAIGKSYCRGGYTLGDVLGFLIVLPTPETHQLASEDITPLIPESFKDRPLVRFKSHLYYEDKDVGGEIDIRALRTGSKIVCFKNGICQGVAYEDIYEGTYFPSVSLYKSSTVKVNFGPKFEYPPSQDDFSYRGYFERAEDAIIEQTLSDVLFLTENDGKLSLENAVPALM